jgi:hypothetical protein
VVISVLRDSFLITVRLRNVGRAGANPWAPPAVDGWAPPRHPGPRRVSVGTSSGRTSITSLALRAAGLSPFFLGFNSSRSARRFPTSPIARSSGAAGVGGCGGGGASGDGMGRSAAGAAVIASVAGSEGGGAGGSGGRTGFGGAARRRIIVPRTRVSTVRPRLKLAIFSLIASTSPSSIELMWLLRGMPMPLMICRNSLLSIPSSCASWNALSFAMASSGVFSPFLSPESVGGGGAARLACRPPDALRLILAGGVENLVRSCVADSRHGL